MTIFNRVVTTLLLLALIPVVTVALISPREAIELLQSALDELYALLDPSPSTAQILIQLFVALVIDAVLVILIYLQLRRPSLSGVRVQRVKGGEAEIAIDSVVGRLTHQLDRLPGVLDVEPAVIPHRKSVEVALDVELAADDNVTANIEEISAVTRRVIEDDMGLKLKGKPKLNLRTVAYPTFETGLPFPSPTPEEPAVLVVEESFIPIADETLDEQDQALDSEVDEVLDSEVDEADEPGSSGASG